MSTPPLNLLVIPILSPALNETQLFKAQLLFKNRIDFILSPCELLISPLFVFAVDQFRLPTFPTFFVFEELVYSYHAFVFFFSTDESVQRGSTQI